MEGERVLTVSDAARVLGEDAQNIRWRIRMAQLRAEKRVVGKGIHIVWVIRPDDLVAWYEKKVAEGKLPAEYAREVRRRVDAHFEARP